MGDEAWKQFMKDNLPPTNLSEIQTCVSNFCKSHASNRRNIVLVTSGGTTVPLEHNTVRFVDNFSAGTRGSASAEYFLEAGYAVIFLHRTKSLEPYIRRMTGINLLKSLVPIKSSANSCKIEVHPDCVPKLLPLITSYQTVCKSNLLLKIPFTTLSEYLHILHIITQELKFMKNNVMLYLAAAVSDFYIPETDMVTHKISSSKPLDLHLKLVPKVLQPLVCNWIPDAFVISFKLETDESILLEKAKMALDKYGHKLVIANELHTRKEKVIFVTKDYTEEITMDEQELAEGKEIEERIVAKLLIMHHDFKPPHYSYRIRDFDASC